MKIQLNPSAKNKSDLEIIAVIEGQEEQLTQINKALPSIASNTYLETETVLVDGHTYLCLGLGEIAEIEYQKVQNWVGTAIRLAAKKSISQAKTSVTIHLPEITDLDSKQYGQAVAIGYLIANYEHLNNYKSDAKPSKLKNIELAGFAINSQFKSGFQSGQVLGEAINLTRRLGDTPPNEMTPSQFLKTAQLVAKQNNLKITVLTESQAKKLGMGAFIGVAQGSAEPSYMIALEYSGKKSSKEKWGLIGKGITFDTGGISIKPSANMHEMKYDMLGAATVLSTIQALAELKVSANVVAVMAVTENAPGGKAQRPGDIIRSYSGKTVEVLNTDAEGRLVLMDALTWAQRDFKATKLIDLATLTGAMIVALGHFYTGAFGNNPKFTEDLIDAGQIVGEKYWPMPMDPVFGDLLKTDFADLANVETGRQAGSIVGAKFIEAVVEEDRPWIHLDIAGTAWDMKNKSYSVAGATGVGIKTLVELIEKSDK